MLLPLFNSVASPCPFRLPADAGTKGELRGCGIDARTSANHPPPLRAHQGPVDGMMSKASLSIRRSEGRAQSRARVDFRLMSASKSAPCASRCRPSSGAANVKKTNPLNDYRQFHRVRFHSLTEGTGRTSDNWQDDETITLKGKFITCVCDATDPTNGAVSPRCTLPEANEVCPHSRAVQSPAEGSIVDRLRLPSAGRHACRHTHGMVCVCMIPSILFGGDG